MNNKPSEAQTATPANYRGRFAPSPTGPLHFGSLLAATASFLQARAASGEWFLRIEDIDPPRAVAGASEQIIDSLAVHGFAWDGPIWYQSANTGRFHDIVERLLDEHLAYRCECTREQVKKAGASGPMGPIYPGTCRDKAADTLSAPTAVRLRTKGCSTQFDDGLQGRVECAIGDEIGDFIIRRKDGLIAYNLAVVVDDHDQGMTEIVRGTDLLPLTTAQICLQQMLNLTTPKYLHVPVAINKQGQKLSKQYGAVPIENSRARANLLACLAFLGLSPPPGLDAKPPGDILSWAVAHWAPEKLPKCQEIAAPTEFSR